NKIAGKDIWQSNEFEGASINDLKAGRGSIIHYFQQGLDALWPYKVVGGLSLGDSGTVLASNGNAKLPSWITASSGTPESPLYISYTGTLSTPIQLSVLRGGLTIPAGT